jgi:gas vesicle protein
MTLQNINLYQYCPFCGGILAFPESFLFCPHCGKKIQKKEPKYKKKFKKRKTEQTDGLKPSSGEVAISLQSEQSKESCQNINENSIDEEKLATQQMNGAAVSVVCEITAPSLKKNATVGTTFLPALPDETHTVILKFCPEKEQLFIKLTKILRRDSFAIRMAVELVPAVLMYKSKLSEVLPVIQVCRAVGALFSIVSGDFTLTVDFSPAVLAELSIREQDLIKNSPPTLWLGETIHFAVGKVMSNGKRGLLVLSNHHLYFVFTGNQGFEYVMIPLERVVAVERAERKKLTTLVVRQQASETLYGTPKQRSIIKLQQLLQTVVDSQ